VESRVQKTRTVIDRPLGPWRETRTIYTLGSPMPKQGRPRTRPETKYIRGDVWIDVPVPMREKMQVTGYEWKSTDLVSLIRGDTKYNPYLEADGYYFDVEEFQKLIHFVVKEIIFPEGINAGDPFIPEMWQWTVYANMFCWKSEETNFRRYREVFIYVPRKNGKTTAFGVVPTLYSFFCSKEKRGQLFCCAADVEQASINFRHCIYNIESNERLISRLRDRKVHRAMRSFEHTDGTIFKVLSSVSETKHGLSPNFVYIDEVHAHRSSELIDVMITGTAARAEPLILYTTTADFDRDSVCNTMHTRATSVQNAATSDPTFYPVLYEANVDDDYNDPKVWEAANPNFNKSIYEQHFSSMLRTAKNSPADLNRFLRLHLNIKTRTETGWIAPYVWAYGGPADDLLLTEVPDIMSWIYDHRDWHNVAHDSAEWMNNKRIPQYIEHFQAYWSWYIAVMETLRDEECYGGYDNSAVSDLSSFGLWFPNHRIMLSWNWVPAGSIHKRSKEDNVPYDMWWYSGLINKTPNEYISEKEIARALVGENGIAHHFRYLRNVCFDRWGSNAIYEAFDDYGIPCKSYPQSFGGMNQPVKQMEIMAHNRELFHGGNPVLKWQMQNISLQVNKDDQQRPSRDASSDKIDGIVALLMALGGWLYQDDEVIKRLGKYEVKDA
jgi:phage terminase large subunit-like protein